jgi:hypothetical protein
MRTGKVTMLFIQWMVHPRFLGLRYTGAVTGAGAEEVNSLARKSDSAFHFVSNPMLISQTNKRLPS